MTLLCRSFLDGYREDQFEDAVRLIYTKGKQLEMVVGTAEFAEIDQRREIGARMYVSAEGLRMNLPDRTFEAIHVSAPSEGENSPALSHQTIQVPVTYLAAIRKIGYETAFLILDAGMSGTSQMATLTKVSENPDLDEIESLIGEAVGLTTAREVDEKMDSILDRLGILENWSREKAFLQDAEDIHHFRLSAPPHTIVRAIGEAAWDPQQEKREGLLAEMERELKAKQLDLDAITRSMSAILLSYPGIDSQIKEADREHMIQLTGDETNQLFSRLVGQFFGRIQNEDHVVLFPSRTWCRWFEHFNELYPNNNEMKRIAARLRDICLRTLTVNPFNEEAWRMFNLMQYGTAFHPAFAPIDIEKYVSGRRRMQTGNNEQ